MTIKTTKISNKDAKKLFSKTYPNFVRFAVANTLTSVSFKGMGHSEDWIKKNWINRNKFLLGGGTGKGAIKYNRAKPSHDLNNIWSSWGSPASVGSKNYKFMADQEDGFVSKGSTPTKNARVGKNYNKGIPRKRRRSKSNIEQLRGAVSSKRMAIIHLRRLYKMQFALPGSKQFFYMKDNQFLNFGAGLYQFTKKTVPNKLSKSGAKLQFPNLKKMYIAGKQNRKTRKDAKWMSKSSLQIKQTDINKIFDKAADQAFAGQLKLWKHF
ncbi:hypothetical protein KAU11_11625 [Candidatus Babeliales bacterium]|nr:hypothetical protein [Candidatus Babeliales bacterium]